MHDAYRLSKSPHLILMLGSIGLLFVLIFRRAVKFHFEGSEIFGIPLSDFVWGLPLFLVSIYFLYTISAEYLFSKFAVWVHALITVILTYILMALILVGVSSSSSVRGGADFLGFLVRVVVWALIIAQLIFVVNVILGLTNSRKLE